MVYRRKETGKMDPTMVCADVVGKTRQEKEERVSKDKAIEMMTSHSFDSKEKERNKGGEKRTRDMKTVRDQKAKPTDERRTSQI